MCKAVFILTSSLKASLILPIVITLMNLEGIMPCEISQRERQTPYDFTYMGNLTNKTSNKTNKANRHRYREPTGSLPEGRGMVGGAK